MIPPNSGVRPRKAAQAAKAINPLDKESWLRVAEEWIKLTQAMERRGD